MIIRERTKDILLKPQHAANIFKGLLDGFAEHDRDKEHFLVFGLDTRNQLKYVDVVSVGTLNYNLVHPREVFRLAVIRACASIIVAHNHPSGSLEPSEEDIKLTKRLHSCGEIMGIQVLDHVILGGENYTEHVSFKMKGLM